MSEVILSKNGVLELIEKLKKANKTRKEQMSKKAGFHNYFEYMGHLVKLLDEKESLEKDKPNVEEKLEVVTHNVMPFETPSVTSEELTDMVIAFDSTGSMRSYIDSVKKYVKDLIPTMLHQNKNLKISIVVFGDYIDMKSVTNHEFGRAYQVIGLTNDEKKLIKFVTGAEDTSGGDPDEFYELVFRKIRTETEWRKGSSKSVLLIADYTPHPKSEYLSGICHKFSKTPIDWKVECELLAKDGIKVDTLRIRPQIQFVQFYEAVSHITGGLSLPFADSEQTSDLLRMSSLARGGSNTSSAFMAMSEDRKIMDNPELKATYAMYKGIVEK